MGLQGAGGGVLGDGVKGVVGANAGGAGGEGAGRYGSVVLGNKG